MLAFGLAGSHTGRLDRRVSDLGVTLGRDFLLCNENLITNRAVLAFGLAGSRAGRLDRRINGLGVCSLLNRFVRPPYLGLTNRAIHDLIVAAFFCASGSDFIFPDCFPGSVSAGRDRLRLGRITDAAGKGLFAGSGASCGGGDNAVVPGVILGFGDRCSGCGLLSTALAIGIAGIALLSAGGRLGITNLGLGVPLGRDLLLRNDNLITDRAVLALGLAGLRAGGRNCFVSDLGVTLGGDFLLLNENLITDRAMLAFGLAGLCAGRLDRLIGDFGVHTRRCTAPNAVYIVDRSPGCRTHRLLIAAVPIAQLGRGDVDVIIC